MADATVSDDFALCLSGGGLRATLFHLGLVKALRCHSAGGRTALSAVREIYSVSGGSILAAHLVKNWDQYNGDDEQFAKMEKEVRDFAGRNIRDRVIRRWLLTRWLGLRRSFWLQKEYEALVGRGSIGDCYDEASANPPPKLHILATSFKTGQLCSFGSDSFELMRGTADKPDFVETPGGHLPLAYAVAASSAFPPLFPPIPLTEDMLRNPEPEDFLGTIHLSDGGVYDNLGVEHLRMSRGRYSNQPGTVIVSNAGGSFRTEPSNRFANMVSRNVRASDILMRRVGESTEKSAMAVPGVCCIPVRISAIVEDRALDSATQQRLRVVRTDLDAFGRDLAELLIGHGYRVGSVALSPEWQTPASPPAGADGSRARRDYLDQVAKAGGKRSAWSLALDFRDWKTLPLLWSLVILVLASASFGVVTARAQKEAKVQAEKAEVEMEKELLRQEKRSAEINRDAMAERLGPIQEAYARKDFARLERLLGASPVASTEDPGPADPAAVDPAKLEVIPAGRLDFAIPPQPRPHRQPVYIQFAGILTRAQIKALNEKLKSAGWSVEGSSGERLATSAGRNEIRFSGENEQAASDLADAINAAGITARPVEARHFQGIGPNLEAWISR